jgi:hypothetical protein
MSRQNIEVLDGLAVGYGPRSADNDTGSVGSGIGVQDEIVLRIPDMTALGTDATADSGIYKAGYWANAPKIPANATIESWTSKVNVVAASDGAADLLLGIFTISPTTGLLVAVDADGLAAAGDSALANFQGEVGETFSLGAAAGAAYLGKKDVGTAAVVVVPTYVTAVYTAGDITIRIRYTRAPA